MTTYTRVLGVATLLGLAGVSVASAQSPNMTATVPFQFTIGKTSIPRDVYEVSRAGGRADILLFRSARRAFLVAGHSTGSTDRDEAPQLVFHRYGEQYFLREVRFPGSLGMNLPVTREERQAAERRADGRNPSVEAVVVLAQRH
jgi:hypothetical protein